MKDLSNRSNFHKKKKGKKENELNKLMKDKSKLKRYKMVYNNG